MPESLKRFSTVFSSGWICIWSSFSSNEMLSGAEKLQLQRRLFSNDGLRFALRFQSLFQNALDAVNVQEVEVESSPTSGVQTSGAVAFSQAQQLLRLAQTAPRKLTAQKLVREITGSRSEFPGTLAVVVGPAQRVGSSAIRVVGVIGRAAAGQLPLMGLDQLAVDIDAHHRSIAADIDLAADPAGGNRIQCLTKTYMVIRMYFALRPSRRIEALALQRKQLGLLLRFEYLKGHVPGGSVDATAGDFATPHQSATRYVVEIDERLPLEEAFPRIRHAIFHHRLVLGMARPGRIGQKAPVVGVLQESTVEARGVGIGLIDTSFHSVQDHAPGTTTKKLPSAFEAIDDRGQVLFENGDHTAEPTVAERHNKALDDTRLAATKFLQWTKSAKVDFSHFAWQALRTPYADRGSTSEIAPLPRKAIQATVGNRQSLAA